MRFIQLAALCALTVGPLWAAQCEPVRAADLTKAAVYGLTLGMSLSDAESILATKRSGLAAASLAEGLLRIRHGFYDCSTRKMILVKQEMVKDKYGLTLANGAQLSPPAGTAPIRIG